MMFAVIAVAVTMGGLAVYVGTGVVKSREATSKRLARLQSRDEVLEAGFSERAVAPVIEKLGTFALRFTPQAALADFSIFVCAIVTCVSVLSSNGPTISTIMMITSTMRITNTDDPTKGFARETTRDIFIGFYSGFIGAFPI